MIPKIDPTQTKAWKALELHFEQDKRSHMRDLFASEPDRFDRFSIEHNGCLLDYSKNRITDQTIELLSQLWNECEVDQCLDAMLKGELINETEGRAVLHTALRAQGTMGIKVNGTDVMPEVLETRKRMASFCEKVIDGSLKGFTHKPIKNIVNLGIGGSDLGPAMVVEALDSFRNHLNVLFVSNVDGHHIDGTIKNLDPETTLFIIASKSFTTEETMANAVIAREWVLNAFGREQAIAKHFVAISTNGSEVSRFGIKSDYTFGFWNWVGGRYSLWGPIGLSIMLALGPDQFDQLLKGAHDMDEHVNNSRVDSIPARLAQLGIWYNNFYRAESHAVIPYAQNLNLLSAYLQQADMESNGKSVSRKGDKVAYETGPIVWGQVGTNAQHAFFQLIHQGTKMIPCDFIAFSNPKHAYSGLQSKLLANCLAQSQALMKGKPLEDALQVLKDGGMHQQEAEKLATYKTFDGNKPSNTILFEELNPFTLGQLIAMYEHKIAIQGFIWNIFSFDQWGVELGKALAAPIWKLLEEESLDEQRGDLFDSSTKGLAFWLNNKRTTSRNLSDD